MFRRAVLVCVSGVKREVLSEGLIMSVTEIVRTAYSGLFAQSKRAETIAANIANAATPGYEPRTSSLGPGAGRVFGAGRQQERQDFAAAGGGLIGSGGAGIWDEQSAPDMANEMLDLIGTRVAWEANATAFETGADFWELLAIALGHQQGPPSSGKT